AHEFVSPRSIYLNPYKVLYPPTQAITRLRSGWPDRSPKLLKGPHAVPAPVTAYFTLKVRRIHRTRVGLSVWRASRAGRPQAGPLRPGLPVVRQPGWRLP